MDLASLLIAFIIFGALFAIIYFVPLPQWGKMVGYILVGAIAAVWVVRLLLSLL